MGINQSIHDINIINAMNNGTDDSLPLTNIQAVSNSISNMQQKYNIIPLEQTNNNNLSYRNSKVYLNKFSSLMLRQNQKTKKIEKPPIKKLKEEQIKENFPILKTKNLEKEDSNLIENCLITHFFMKILNKQARDAIIQEMSLVKVKENTYIFEQGNIGNYFYILKKGNAQLIINNKVVRVLKIGESFGELALLHDAPRSGKFKIY